MPPQAKVALGRARHRRAEDGPPTRGCGEVDRVSGAVGHGHVVTASHELRLPVRRPRHRRTDLHAEEQQQGNHPLTLHQRRSSSSSAPWSPWSASIGRTKAARTGGGIVACAPRTALHTISLSSRSGARSGSEKSMAMDAAAPGADASFRSARRTRAGRCVYGVRAGEAWKERYIGAAAASYWLMGGRPRMSSIVRSIPDVVYSVLSTAPRRT